MSEIVEGYVEKIVFRNSENGYTVLSLSNDEEEITCVGTFPFINEGEFIEAEGSYTAHPVYGEQLKVARYEVKNPEDIVSIERYLGSGAIKGIGVGLASRIVKKFKKDTFHIIEDEPERLSEIKGISERMARDIATQFEEKREMRGAMIFLQQYGITTNLAVKIYNTYGQKLYEIIRENPYRLADDIHGIGFRLADDIAVKVGIGSDSDYRIKAGIQYILQRAGASEGHVYLPWDELLARAQELLLVEKEKVSSYIMDMVMDKRIVVKETKEGKLIYSFYLYYMEMNCARMLLDLNITYPIAMDMLSDRIEDIERLEEIKLDEMQRTAVMEAARCGLLVITGGPGTGKTTTINTIIKYFEAEGMDILLAAPTGRAAKRMAETTGYEAQTIHRLLELTGKMEEEKGTHFERNETNPLEADAVIIDEMSMVDINLMNSLLKAILVGTRLILVGDVNQLPSVGPGNVLKDIISSRCFNVVKLTKIFRQAASSDIIVNAHKINDGLPVVIDNKSRDFFLLERDNPNVIISIMIQLIQQKLPKYVDATAYDIQVLTPMRKGELGVERLNKILQQYLNPPDSNKVEKDMGQALFREGDKVMQIKNNYQIEWEVRSAYGVRVENGTGVFNGDCGVIKEINLYAELIIVEFEEGKIVEYPFASLDELELAYAITIHKSQGSEYPAIILPLLSGPRMLLNRNLLYTAITRAKKCVTIVGKQNVVHSMIANAMEQKRYSGLCGRILEIDCKV